MSKQLRVLISRPDRLGDVVLSTPLPREIKKAYPDAFIGVIVKNYTKNVYLNNPYVDVIITDDYNEENKRKTFWEKVNELKKYKFNTALMLLPTERHNWMFFFARIKTRIGVGHKFYQFISFAKSVSRNNYNPLRSEADYCMDLARKIGVKTDNISTEIHLTDEEKIKVKKRKDFLSNNGEKIIVGVHSTFGQSTPNMKPFEYRNLIDKLLGVDKYKVVVTDYKIPEEVNEIPDVTYLDSSGRDFFCDIAALDILVSSSTGPSHVAAALKVPTLTLFCPLPACSPTLWSPQGNRAFYILPEKTYCQNKCPKDPKLCWFEGEGGINGNKVFTELEKVLKELKGN